MRILLLASVLGLLAGSGAVKPGPTQAKRLAYPPAPKVDQVDEYHGVLVKDPYRWLEDVDSEQTRAWVAAENELTFGYLEKIPARERIRQRLTELWDYPRYSPPEREGDRLFFDKNDGLQAQSVLYVQDPGAAEPRVLLDPNTLSADGTTSLAERSVSRSGRWLAWSTSESGSDWRTWRVRNVDTGEDLDDVIRWSKFSGASWLPDDSGFFYSRYAAPSEGDTLEGTNYYQKVYFHRRGTAQDEDRLIYERPDHKDWGFGAGVSEDGHYLILQVWQGTARENRLFYLDLTQPGSEVVELLDEADASYEYVGNDGPVFIIKTDLDAPRARIIAIDTAAPARENWRTLVPEGEDPLEGATLLNEQLVLTYMHDVKNVVRIHERDGTFVREIALPGPGSVGGFTGHRDDTETWYVFTSYLNPSEIYHHDFKTGQTTLYWKPDIDFDFSDYVTEQIFYHSKDGTRVPMFIVHRRDLQRDGSHPTILFGYGGFNISLTPYFSAGLLPWLEMGGIFASANLRGGGEYGEEWHRAGMLASKQNVFDDFIAAAEYLIAEDYTATPKLSIYGGSNGGLLVGAVLNQRPDLFGAAVPAVGVMDMLRFQKSTIGWAWVSDYGSSDDPEMFPILRAYSPYHNIRDGVSYPAVMIMTADHDDRVVPGHSFKYAARLQAAQAGDAPILIRIQTKSGHGAGKPTAMIIQEYADRYAFLTKVLKMDVK
jgi:prolyl oligopeptidase